MTQFGSNISKDILNPNMTIQYVHSPKKLGYSVYGAVQPFSGFGTLGAGIIYGNFSNGKTLDNDVYWEACIGGGLDFYNQESTPTKKRKSITTTPAADIFLYLSSFRSSDQKNIEINGRAHFSSLARILQIQLDYGLSGVFLL
jgi:hypothetical protein